MPRLIFKCPYVQGGSQQAAAHLGNYVRYMATREGAQKFSPGQAQLPATEKQRGMVDRLLRDFPLSRGTFEYGDYAAAPTRGNASEFISRALEDNYDAAAKKGNYVSYIASRPRAQRTGTHALFTGSDEPLTLSRVVEEVAHHPGNVWLPIISLRREDAARLGYDDSARWKSLLTGYAVEMAQAMKIPWGQFRWYAAFHDEGHHPHVHMVCYSADGKSGYLTKEGFIQIKYGLAREVFRNELTELYQQQTQHRDDLTQRAGQIMGELIRQMETGTLENPRIEQLLAHLAGKLKHLSGKKQYGYLKAPLRAVVDEIVDELAKDPRIAQAYELWYEMREEVLRTYKNDLSERLPLSRQKEFKPIKNMVIREAVRLGEITELFASDDLTNGPDAIPERGTQYTYGKLYLLGRDVPRDSESALKWFSQSAAQGSQQAQYFCDHIHEFHGPPLTASMLRLLHLMAGIFREQEPRLAVGPIRFTDKKLRRKIQAKKIAMGHKPDDHEDPTMTMQPE